MPENVSNSGWLRKEPLLYIVARVGDRIASALSLAYGLLFVRFAIRLRPPS